MRTQGRPGAAGPPADPRQPPRRRVDCHEYPLRSRLSFCERVHADQPSDGTVVQNSGRTRVVNLFFSTDKDYLFMTFRYVGDFLAAGDFGCRGRARPKKFEGATAVKLVARSNC